MSIHAARASEDIDKTAAIIESTNKEIQDLENASKKREEVLQSRETKAKLSASKILEKEVIIIGLFNYHMRFCFACDSYHQLYIPSRAFHLNATHSHIF